MNGGKETGASLGRNKTAQFSLTECLSNYLTQWKRSQNITAKYLWNKMYNSAGTWQAAQAPRGGLTVLGLTGAASGSVDGRPEQEGEAELGGRGEPPGDRAAGGEGGFPLTRKGDYVQGRRRGGISAPAQRKWACDQGAAGKLSS